MLLIPYKAARKVEEDGMLSNRVHFGAIVLVAVAMAAGCMGDSWSLSRVARSEDPRYAELLRRMNLTLVRTVAGSTTTIDQNATTFASTALAAQCGLPTVCATAGAGTSCTDRRACVRATLCIANELLRVEQSPAPTVYDVEVAEIKTLFEVPPQDNESNVALAEVAAQYADAASVHADAAIAACSAILDDPGAGGNDVGTEIAASWIEAFNLRVEAADDMERAALAVADGAYAENSSIADSANLALTASHISRAHIGHHLVGGAGEGSVPGEAGLPGLGEEVDTNGFCPDEPLSADAIRALELLRQAGPPPSAVRIYPPGSGGTTLTLDQLITGAPGFDGLRSRWAVQLGEPLVATLSPAALYNRFGVTEQAFLDARSYLSHELVTFDRDPTMLVPGDPLENGATTSDSFNLYAATRVPPQPALPVYAAAITAYRPDSINVSYESDWVSVGPLPVATASGYGYFPEDPARYYEQYDVSAAGEISNLAHYIDAGLERMTNRLLDLEAGGSEGADLLSSHIGALRTTSPGWVQVCSFIPKGTTNHRDSAILDVRVHFPRDPKELLVVAGRSGLECAVRGSVDGAECDLNDYRLTPAAGFEWSPVDGETTRAGFSAASIPRSNLAPEASQIFVTTGPEVQGGNPREGAYTALAGAVVRLTTTAASNDLFLFENANTYRYQHCNLSIISPELAERTAAAIGADPANCSRPRADCAGMPDLIPLENELTSDGDGVESSWRHYLLLARNSADEADRLGEEVIRNGLDMDLRAEAAIDELEDICGVSINVNPVASPPSPTNGPCSAGSCAAPYVCSAETCVLDPVLYAASLTTGADAQRIADCLGADSEIRYTALGDRHLCVWDYGGDTGTACLGAGEDGAPSCPWAPDGVPLIDPVTLAVTVPDASVCAATPGVPAGPGGASPAFHVSDRMALFHLPDPGEPGATAGTETEVVYPCDALARMRAGVDEGTEVRSSPFFELSNVAAAATRLSWYPVAGDVSRVTWDGSSIISTGNLDGSAPSDWPCSSDPLLGMGPLCPITPTSDPGDPTAPPLSCFQNVCGDATDRAQMNDMLARAVMAVRVATGVGLYGVRVPYYPTADDSGLRLQPEEGGTEGWDVGTVRSSGAYFQRTLSGAVGVRGGSDQNFGIFERPLSDLDARAERIYPSSGNCSSAAGASFEWRNCPYDRGACIEFFDDGPDPDDFVATSCVTTPVRRLEREWDRDMPMLVRTLPALLGSDPNTFVTRLWSGRRPAAGSTDITADFFEGRMNEVLGPTGVFSPRTRVLTAVRGFFDETTQAHYPLSSLTSYFRRSWCGDVGGPGCEGDLGWRHADEERIIIDSLASCVGPNCEDVGCNGNYFACDDAAENAGLDFPSLRDGNRAFIAPDGFTRQDLLNGLELLCFASMTSVEDVTDVGLCGGEMPPVERLADLARVERFMECQGNAIRARAARTVAAGLPRTVVETVRRESGSVSGDSSGEYAAASAEISAAYTNLRDTENNIALVVETLSNEMGLLRNAIARSRYANQIEDLSLQSQIFDRVTSCITAVAEVSKGSVWSIGGGIASATATCVNTGVQIGLAARIRDLRGSISELDTEDAFLRFDQRVSELTTSLSREANALNAALQRVDAALSRLEALQQRGRRALARSLFLDNDATGRHMAVDTVMRARYNTGLHRYREAHQRAVTLAYIARVALEQRLGMTLDSMDDDLVTVEAPSGWADTICGLPSIDYDAIRMGDLGSTGEREGDSSTFMAPDGYSGAYVGDYVRRLEQVFESYNFAYPFQDGTDVAVLSLRDDIHGVRDRCPVAGPNLLYQAGHLDRFATETAPGWVQDGCTVIPEACLPGVVGPDCWPGAVDAPTVARPPACVSASEIDGIDEGGGYVDPIPADSAEFGRVPGYRVFFGSPGVSADVVAPAGNETYYGAAPENRMLQWVNVTAGRYRLSVYTRTPTGDLPSGVRVLETTTAAADDFDRFLRVVRAINLSTDVNGELTWTEQDVSLIQHQVTAEGVFPGGWVRHHAFIDVPGDTVLGITLDPKFEGVPEGARFAVLDVTGMMLENVTGAVDGSVTAMVAAENAPGPFFDTTDVLTRPGPACEDTDGSLFRERSWSPGCVRVCPDGYDGSCAEGEAETRCYWETSFSASSDVLERLAGRSSAGFASGSYNYRIETIGVNLVGTGLRDCEGVATPSTCYAAGNTAFSVIHNGPFLVRNARGALYNAPLFTGRIESARALAAERYLTNPLSGADRGLIEPYSRIELRGRPLGGSLTLRIWNDAAFRFDRLEDVQLVLGYRYWTRQR